jgi:hypothetical protein
MRLVVPPGRAALQVLRIECGQGMAPAVDAEFFDMLAGGWAGRG